MNHKLRRPLIVIGLITIIVLAIFVVPRGLSVFYQIRGGQRIEYILRFEEGLDALDCEPLSPDDEDSRNEVEHGKVDLERSISLNKNNSQAYLYLGKAHCLLGDAENAVEDYLRYTEIRPENPLGFISLGFAYEKSGDERSATKAWQTADISSRNFISRGDEEFNKTNYDEAIRWYERAINIEPKYAEAYLYLGKVYEAKQDYKGALKSYSTAWDLNPEVSTTDLIRSNKRNGDLKSVENTLQHMLENYQNSQDRLLWFQELGSSYLSHGDYDQAVDLYSQAISEFPDQPELHIALGWAIYERGDGIDAARNEIEMAIAVDEDNASGYYALGQLMTREEDYDEAEIWYQQASDIEPANRWYLLVLGNTKRSNGNLQSAIDIFNQIIEENPTYDLAFLEIAWTYKLLNRDDEAITTIEKAIEFATNPTEWYFIRAGGIYEQAEDYNSAIRYYHQALAINPTNSTALQALSRLED